MFTCKIQIESNDNLEHILALIISDILYAEALSSVQTCICWKENLAENGMHIYSNITVREKNKKKNKKKAVKIAYSLL